MRRAALTAALMSLSPLVTVDAQNRQPIERLLATSVNMSNVGPAAPGRIEVVIERWSSERERNELIATLKDKGSDALLSKLQNMPRVGYIRDANGIRSAGTCTLHASGSSRTADARSCWPRTGRSARGKPSTARAPQTMSSRSPTSASTATARALASWPWRERS